MSNRMAQTPPLLLVLDEIDKMCDGGKTADFGLFQAANLGREYGLQILLTSQSVENLYGLSPDFNPHGTMGGLAGFPMVLSFRPGDPTTISTLQTMFGSDYREHLVLPPSRYGSAERKLVREPLVTDRAFAGLDTGDCYVKIGTCPPQQEGAVACNKLPAFEKSRLQAAKATLVEEVKHTSGRDISGLKLYLIPGDRDMQATAYGASYISVARGTFDNADPITLNAVLAHEISHTLHCDPEFSRGVFASIVLLMGAISMMSLVLVGILFLVFAVLSGFRSWLGVMAFQGTAKLVTGFFSLLQRCVVAVYQAVMGLVSHQAEYRNDLYPVPLDTGSSWPISWPLRLRRKTAR